MPIVDVKGIGEMEFPEGMSQDEMSDAIHSYIANPPEPKGGTSADTARQAAAARTQQSVRQRQMGPLTGFGEEAAKGVPIVGAIAQDTPEAKAFRDQYPGGVTAAHVAGGMVGGAPMFAAAGPSLLANAGVGAAVNAADSAARQKVDTGQVDWGDVAKSGAVGGATSAVGWALPRAITPFPGRVPVIREPTVNGAPWQETAKLDPKAFNRAFRDAFEENNPMPAGRAKQEAWEDFKSDNADLLAPGGWKGGTPDKLSQHWLPLGLGGPAPKGPGGFPKGISDPRATPQMPPWLDKAATHAAAVLGPGAVGHMAIGPAGEMLGLAGGFGAAAANHNGGIFNSWLRNQTLPSGTYPHLQAVINALSRNASKPDDQ